MSVKKHYDNHLGNFYSWMTGDFESKSKAQEEFFKTNNILPRTNSVAIDLGAGHGLQSIPLAKLGFKVTAVDFNQQLLDELKENAKDYDIDIINDDITNTDRHISSQPELIVCMGDTITHLRDINAVNKLVCNTYMLLGENGRIIISYRDLSNELEGDNRFIPVKSDDNRIHTCFLEYFADYVMVHDLLHEKTNNEWKQKLSSYPKIKIPQSNLKEIVLECGFKIIKSEIIQGMTYIIAEK